MGERVNSRGTGVDGQAALPQAVALGANPPDGGHDRDAIERFIDELCFNAPGLMQSVKAEGKDLYPRFHTTDSDGLNEALTRYDNLSRACAENTHLYVQVTTCRTNPNAGYDQPEHGVWGRKRGGKENVSHLLCLWNDIDFGEDGHAETKDGRLPNPPDAAAAHEIYLNSGLPEASVVVNSGGGLYEIVLLEEPLDLSDPEVRARAESVCKRWQQLIEKTARDMGYRYGAGVSNLDRLLRVPGTVNTKVWDNKRRAVAHYNEDAAGVPRYAFDQLEARINELYPEPEPPRRPDGGPIEAVRWSPGDSSDRLRPGDDFNLRADWDRDILAPAGITYSHACGEVTYWFRPGKGGRDNHGFSLNHKPDLLFSFTDGTVLPQWKYYDKFSAYAWLVHRGNFSAAARHLRELGYGSDDTAVTAEASPEIPAQSQGPEPSVSLPLPKPPIPLEEPPPQAYDLSRMGDLGVISQAVADNLAVPGGMVLMGELGSVSTAIGGRRRVQVRPGWTEPVVTHTLALAPPGSRKSAVMSKVTEPLKSEERKRRDDDRTQVQVDRMRRQILDDQIKAASSRAAKSNDPNARAAAEAEAEGLVMKRAVMGEPKEETRLMTSDITPEELAYLMARQGGRMAVMDSEAAFLSNISGRYSPGGRPKVDLVLNAYDQQSYTVDRVGRDEPVEIDTANLTVALAVQGDAITGLGKSCQEMDRRGTWGRYLYDVTPGHVLRTVETRAIPEEVEQQHTARIEQLMKVCYDGPETVTMTLSDEARTEFFAYYLDSDPALRGAHHRVRIQGWEEKQPGRLIRIAALRTLYEDPHALEIPGHIMRDVIALDETMRQHAHKAAGYMSLTDSDPLEPARDVLGWLLEESPQAVVKTKDVLRAMKKRRRPWAVRFEDAGDAVEVLEEYGHIYFMRRLDGSVIKGEFRVSRYHVPDAEVRVSVEIPAQAGPMDEDEQYAFESGEETRIREEVRLVAAFVAECCRTGDPRETKVKTSDLYDAYLTYRSKSDAWIDPSRFGKALSRAEPSVTKKRLRDGGERPQFYAGIALLT